MAGSPPRVRGTVGPAIRTGHWGGITPACAGNSEAQAIKEEADKDHPRVCGEQHASPKRPDISAGSPPRVRGTAAVVVGPFAWWRITPACAGNRHR